VTETAIGEAAWSCLNGIERKPRELLPSNWLFSPVPVDWVLDTGGRRTVDVMNHWEPVAIEALSPGFSSTTGFMNRLESLATARCTQLTSQ